MLPSRLDFVQYLCHLRNLEIIDNIHTLQFLQSEKHHLARRIWATGQAYLPLSLQSVNQRQETNLHQESSLRTSW